MQNLMICSFTTMSGGLVKARSARALLDITQRVGNISARSEECKSKTICGIYAEEKMEKRKKRGHIVLQSSHYMDIQNECEVFYFYFQIVPHQAHAFGKIRLVGIFKLTNQCLNRINFL